MQKESTTKIKIINLKSLIEIYYLKFQILSKE